MESYGSGDRSPSAASNDSSSSSNSSASSSAASSASANVASHTPSNCNNSIRDLDELLMGGNDIDALQFEFGCDFSAAFEDKYLVPPLSTSSTPRLRLAAMGGESGIDILPPLSASLLSPPTSFHLCSPPSRFLHGDHYDLFKSLHSRRNSSTSIGVLSFERALDAAASRCSSAASHSTLNETMHSLSRAVGRSDADAAPSRASTPDGSEISEEASVRGSKSTHIGRWTKKEHELFLEGLKLYGKSWKKISSLVVTRTLVQIRTHAQKYLQKQAKNAQKAAAAAAAASADEDVSSSKPSRHQSQRLGQSFGEHVDPWKGAPIGFSGLPPAHSGSSSAFSRTAALSSYVLPTIGKRDANSSGMCKLEQLLQDEPSQYAAMDGYYQSPLGTDDEILPQPLYAPWLRSNSHDGGASSLVAPPLLSLPAKRRRLDPHQQQLVNPMEAMPSSMTPVATNHVSMFGTHQQHASSSLYGGMDFSHTPHQLQQHAYAASVTQFVDSSEYATSADSSSSTSSSYGSWQLQ